ncbi:MAG: hypothetical protein LBM93_13880 [Oscillospiraceae bacterium]|jgi:hypothetical protein|nr:hypothetical protein [Oscillospiraceae bacterium]
MFNEFKLIKIIKAKYVEALMSGEIHMNSLAYFRANEDKSLKQGVQGDLTEGTLGIIGGKVSEISKYLESSGNEKTNQAFRKDIDFFNHGPFDVTIERDGKKYTGGKIDKIDIPNDTDGFSLYVGEANSYDKCFCLYTLYYDDEYKKILKPNVQIKEFGDYVVIIKDVLEFLKRIIKAAHEQGGTIRFQKIRYKDFGRKNIEFWGEGVKDIYFQWQNEYRIIYNEKNPTSSFSKLNIGKLSKDIAEKMTIEEFFERNYPVISKEHETYEVVEMKYSAEQQDIDFCIKQEKLLLQHIHALEPKYVRKIWQDTINISDEKFFEIVKGNAEEYVTYARRLAINGEYNKLQIEMFYLIIRILENYCTIGDILNVHLYYTKFMYYYEVANIAETKISKLEDDHIKRLLEKSYNLIKKDYEYLCKNNDREYYMHAFAIMATHRKEH